ncbi:hypothetical protein [Actinosynnema mirum]|uniref:Uncharacterized protein n=1 Tax=Actinosynnema mirum (strain ATCC 29888 / DSM 43827 / JCM 3225 / NBRC 14064 / NCIMB 13271 / NRRL B-12336 / IMRU 3971 / 101) TaxID=446462 RepID=C6W816_ACTMD|nr:hypothetical protein [Actinosynnema mirum]ACU37037.1 hypothetical protein Amir_3124 [Actinosynnema mirum DSM 43827]
MDGKAERWLVVVMGAVVLAAGGVFSTWVGRVLALEHGSGFAGGGAWLLVGVVGCGVGAAVVFGVRGWAVRRFVVAAVASRRYRRRVSPALPLTVAGVLLVTLAAGWGFALLSLVEPGGEQLGDGSGGSLLLALLGVVCAGLHFSWRFRRRVEVPPLVAAGLARVAEPPEVPRGARAFSWRLREFTSGVVIEGTFFLVPLAGAALSGEVGFDERTQQGLFMVFAGPGLVSGMLLLLMMVPAHLRWIAVDALRQPSSLLALALVGGAFAVDWAHGHGGVPAPLHTAAQVAVLVGVLLASATCMGIMERGPQPWLGLYYLGFSYLLGYLTAPGGTISQPEGVAGWVAAIGALGYCLREGREHWERHHGVTPVVDVA